VVVLSHDMAFLAELADRVVVMAAGSVLADATPREVFADAVLLRRAGLEAPQVTSLAAALASDGHEPWPPITIDEAVRVLRAREGTR